MLRVGGSSEAPGYNRGAVDASLKSFKAAAATTTLQEEGGGGKSAGDDDDDDDCGQSRE